MDDWLRSSKKDRSRVREVHPEVSFWAMRGGHAFQESKKSREGRAARRATIERCLEAGVFERARAGYRKKDVADDDILDAFAALWTAERIERGLAKTLPEHPPRDSRGLPMQIVY
jgi:predicted RNase H-like nuclease